MTWTLAAHTLAAFLVWNLLAWPVLPAWSGVVAEIVEFLWNVVTPHGPESHDVAHLGMALVPRQHGRFAGSGDADVECCPLHDGVVGRTRRIEFNPGSLGRRRRTRPSAVAKWPICCLPSGVTC